MTPKKKQTSIYLEEQDEQNINTIMIKTALKRQNDVVLYALRYTAEGLVSEKREVAVEKKSYFDEKAFATFVDLMLANGLDIDMIRDIALKNVDKLISQYLKKYSE